MSLLSNEKLDQFQNQREPDPKSKRKEGGSNSFSEEGSLQNTRSAVEHPNLIQQCTEPSEGKNKSNDSHQSSAVSQYFNQVVDDDQNEDGLLDAEFPIDLPTNKM